MSELMVRGCGAESGTRGLWVGWLCILAICPTFAGAAGRLVQRVRVPEGGICPQAAVDDQGVLHVIYTLGDPGAADIFYARSGDDGATFSKPIRVNSVEKSAIVVGTIRGPQLAIGRSGRVHVAWMGSSKSQRDAKAPAPMLYTRLDDSGQAFEPQRNVIQQHDGLDGGGSVAADADGNVYVAWHAPRAEQNEADRYVWLVRSRDDGQTFGPEIKANSKPTGACACCGMKIFAGAQGRVYILYRSAGEMVHRDMHLLVSRDAGASFEDAMVHPWNVNYCVMSSSAFAQGPKELVAATWETERQIYWTKLDARKLTCDAPMAAEGRGENRKHPTLAINAKGQIVLAWSEGTAWARGGSVAWQVYDAEGQTVERGRGEGLATWSMPAAFVGKDGAFRILY